MANSRRSEKVGRQAQSIGRSAELRVIDELNSAGWRTVTSAELDYAGKTDARATCPAGRELPIQVSVNPKSSKAQRGLEDRGVTPVSIATLDRTEQNKLPPNFYAASVHSKLAAVSEEHQRT